jgi:hypothetical protein
MTAASLKTEIESGTSRGFLGFWDPKRPRELAGRPGGGPRPQNYFLGAQHTFCHLLSQHNMASSRSCRRLQATLNNRTLAKRKQYSSLRSEQAPVVQTFKRALIHDGDRTQVTVDEYVDNDFPSRAHPVEIIVTGKLRERILTSLYSR